MGLPTISHVSDCVGNPNAQSDPPVGFKPYDSAPWDTTSQNSFRNVLEGWDGPGQIHNLVHVWVVGIADDGQLGTMNLMTSPNDPVFWLHHCYVDLLWADWTFRWAVVMPSGPITKYMPSGTPQEVGPLGHNLNDAMEPWGGATTPASVIDHLSLGYYYYDPATI